MPWPGRCTCQGVDLGLQVYRLFLYDPCDPCDPSVSHVRLVYDPLQNKGIHVSSIPHSVEVALSCSTFMRRSQPLDL